MVRYKAAVTRGAGSWRAARRSQTQRSNFSLLRKKPWCATLGEFSRRFGIRNLQDTLSSKLTSHILKILPEISKRVESKLRDVNVQTCRVSGASQGALSYSYDGDRHSKCCYRLSNSVVLLWSIALERTIARLSGNCASKLQGAQPQLVLTTPGFVPPPNPSRFR